MQETDPARGALMTGRGRVVASQQLHLDHFDKDGGFL
jgi:hypothetical protein